MHGIPVFYASIEFYIRKSQNFTLMFIKFNEHIIVYEPKINCTKLKKEQQRHILQ